MCVNLRVLFVIFIVMIIIVFVVSVLMLDELVFYFFSVQGYVNNVRDLFLFLMVMVLFYGKVENQFMVESFILEFVDYFKNV